MSEPAQRREGYVYDGPEDIEQMINLASALAAAKTLPGHLNRSVPDLLYTMLAARSLKMPLFVAIQGLYPSTHPETKEPGGLAANARVQRALVLRAGYRIEERESTDTACSLVLIGPDGQPCGTARYTIEDAITAGLPERDPYFWTHHRTDMLNNRATTRLLGRNASHVTMGLTDTGEPGSAYSAPADPIPEAASAPADANPLRHDLDAATDYYDPQTAMDWTPVQWMRPDKAVHIARYYIDAVRSAAYDALVQAEQHPTDTELGQRASLLRDRLRWAVERADAAEQRASEFLTRHPQYRPQEQSAPAEPPAEAEQQQAPAARSTADSGTATATVPAQRTDSPDTAQTASEPEPRPAAEPTTDTAEPATARPAARKRASSPRAKKTAEPATQPATAPQSPAPDGPSEPQASPQQRAAELWASAQDARDPKRLANLFEQAEHEQVSHVPLHGTRLRDLMAERARELQESAQMRAAAARAAAPIETGQQTTLDALSAADTIGTGDCTCDAVQLMQRQNRHQEPCPQAGGQ